MQDTRNPCEHAIDRSRDSAAGRDRQGIAVLDSANLFADRREVRIRHRGDIYRLLMTKNGKLILNK
jgi:hemin uptake protein HemP